MRICNRPASPDRARGRSRDSGVSYEELPFDSGVLDFIVLGLRPSSVYVVTVRCSNNLVAGWGLFSAPLRAQTSPAAPQGVVLASNVSTASTLVAWSWAGVDQVCGTAPAVATSWMRSAGPSSCCLSNCR